MNQVTITIAGRNYTVKQLPIRANREWREQFDKPINTLLGAAQGLGSLAGKDFESDRAGFWTSLGEVLLGRVNELGSLLLDSMDLILDALFAYSPELAADRKRIEDEGFDDEAMKAFIEVVKIAYPFGSLMNFAGKITQKVEETSPSSAGQSGT